MGVVRDTPTPSGSAMAVVVGDLLVTAESNDECRYFYLIVAADRTGGITREWESAIDWEHPASALAAGAIHAAALQDEED